MARLPLGKRLLRVGFSREFLAKLSSDTPLEVWEEVANRIKAGLQPLIAFTQPDVVCYWRERGSVHILFFRYFKRSSGRNLPAAISVPKIISAPNPEEIVLYGCYDNAISQLASN